MNEVYHSPFVQKVFPFVTLQVSLNIFPVLNHFGSVYVDDDVNFVAIKFFPAETRTLRPFSLNARILGSLLKSAKPKACRQGKQPALRPALAL